MGVDPIELFGDENMSPERKSFVIARLRELPVSNAIKRTVYARWCALVDVPIDVLDMRLVQKPLGN